MHRSALPSGMYECQTQSKSWGLIEKTYGCYFDLDNLYDELYSKHFNKFYNGKPTKRYLKLMRKLQEYSKQDYRSFERLLTYGK